MNTFILTILSLSLSGGIFIAVLFLCKPFYRERLSKKWQYYIWLIVVMRLLLPFSFEVNLIGSLFGEIIQINSAIFEEAESGDIVTYNEVQIVVPNMPGTQIDSPNIPNNTNEQVIDLRPAVDIYNSQITNAYQQTDIRDAAAANIWLVWLIAAIALLVRKITIYQGFVRYIKAGRIPVDNIENLEKFGKIVEEMNIKRTVGFYTNSLISSPLLIGFFHPCIILPSLNISESDFRNTILHELTHYKRGDMFYKWLVQLTICLHWFNPLVYLMGREINNACEFSCDEAVIKNLDYSGMRAYGDTLINALGVGGEYKNSLSSVTLNENKNILKERLNMIMKFKKKSKFAIACAAAVTLIFGIGAGTAGAYGAESPFASRQNAHEIIGEVIGNSSVNDDNIVINLSNAENRQISRAGSFQARDNQILILRITSSIIGGTVDLFLFAPDGTEHRITVGATALTTRQIELTEGLWAYNAFGMFRGGGDINIVGRLSESDLGQSSTNTVTNENEDSVPDRATIPINPTISRERALEIGGEYIGSRPVITLPPSIEWAHGRWVWVVWLLHEQNNWETNIMQIDANTGEVLGHVSGRGNEFYRAITPSGEVEGTQGADIERVASEVVESNIPIINGDFELHIPFIAVGEEILVGRLNLEQGQAYRKTAFAAQANGIFIGVRDVINTEGIQDWNWSSYFASQAGMAVVSTAIHQGEPFVYLFVGSCPLSANPTDLTDVTIRLTMLSDSQPNEQSYTTPNDNENSMVLSIYNTTNALRRTMEIDIPHMYTTSRFVPFSPLFIEPLMVRPGDIVTFDLSADIGTPFVGLSTIKFDNPAGIAVQVGNTGRIETSSTEPQYIFIFTHTDIGEPAATSLRGTIIVERTNP